MKGLRSYRRIRSAEIDGEVEGTGSTVADGSHGRPIEVAIKANVRRRNRNRCEDVYLDVRPVRWLRILGDGLDYVCAGNVIRPSCADGVVCSVQGHGARRATAPGEVLVVADDRHHLLIGVGNGVDDRVCTGVVSVVAAIRGAGIVLGLGTGGQEESGGNECGLHGGFCRGAETRSSDRDCGKDSGQINMLERTAGVRSI